MAGSPPGRKHGGALVEGGAARGAPGGAELPGGGSGARRGGDELGTPSRAKNMGILWTLWYWYIVLS